MAQLSTTWSARGFESPDQSSGAFEYTFEQPGTYEYACTIPPGKDGSVVVEAGSG